MYPYDNALPESGFGFGLLGLGSLLIEVSSSVIISFVHNANVEWRLISENLANIIKSYL